jgi:hypothetical protein
MKKYFIFTSAFLTHFFITSSFASAQGAVGQATEQGTKAIRSLDTLVTTFTETLGTSLGTLAMAAGVIAFFYGIVQYIWGVREAKPEVIKTGNQFMMYGLLALFVMFSVYGIIKFGQRIFFSDIDTRTIEIPDIKFKRSNGGDLGPSGTSNSTGGVTPEQPLGTSNPTGVSGFNPTTSSSARLGEYCNRDIRCGQGSCVNSVCTSSAYNPTTSSSAGLGDYCNRDIRCGQGICSGSVCVVDAPAPDQSNQSTRGTAQCDTLTAQECSNYNDINTNAPCSWDSVERLCLPN